MNDKILITGATGATGGYTIENLIQLGAPVRAMVHSIDERSHALSLKGVEVVKGDINDFEAVSSALKGITAAYFVFPIHTPGILEATAMFAEASRENGVRNIVNMSQITARHDSKSHAAQGHWIAERLLDNSGIPVTHLRPTLFCEWLEYFAEAIRTQNVLPLPFGDGKYAPIAADDQGRVIANILMKPAEHLGKTYSLFGPKELSQYEIAGLLTDVLKRTITYLPLEVSQFTNLLQEKGFTAHFRQHMSAVAEDCRAGRCAGLNTTVEDLTGRKPIQMLDFIIKHKSIFI